MKKRRLAAILLSLLSFNALNSSKLSLNLLPTQSCSAKPVIKCPSIVVIMGENKEDNNKMASLVLANDDDLKLKDIEITKFNPMELYGAKNNPDLKVAVINYDLEINDDFNKISSIFRDKFDCMDIIIHVSNKNAFTFKKIKGFYDKLNEAVIGKDIYKTMVYSNIGESARFELWRYMQNKFDTKQFRYLFFIYNGAKEELIKLKDYNALDSYISGMPDARSIYPIDLNGKNTKIISNFVNNFIEQSDNISKNQTSERLEKLLKKKLQNGVFQLGNSSTQEQHSNKCSTIQTKIQTHTQPQVLQPNRSLSSGQIGLICSLAGVGAISAAVAGVLIKKKLSAKPKITKPEVKNKETKNLKNNKLLT